MLGAVLSFIACGTYEIGYVFAALLALVVWLLRRRSVKNALLDTAPALGGMGAALVFHVLCGAAAAPETSFLWIFPPCCVTRAADGRVAPWAELPPFAGGRGVITNGDRLWPLALGVLAGLLIFFCVPL